LLDPAAPPTLALAGQSRRPPVAHRRGDRRPHLRAQPSRRSAGPGSGPGAAAARPAVAVVGGPPPAPALPRPRRHRTHGTGGAGPQLRLDRKSTRLNSSHVSISYAVLCLKKKKRQDKRKKVYLQTHLNQSPSTSLAPKYSTSPHM